MRQPHRHPPGEGQTLLLAIDDHLLPLRRHLCHYLTKPTVRREPVLAPTRDNPLAPDTLAAHFYGTVLHDGGRFRMWYYPCSFTCAPKDVPKNASLQWLSKNLVQGPACYAESDDGIHWRKPSLRQVRFKGSLDNNAIALSRVPTVGVTLIRDDDDPDPRRRYKMVYNCHAPSRTYYTFRTATSPDGIRWKVRPGFPVASFVEQASFYKHKGLYIVNAQGRPPVTMSEGGGDCGRRGMAWVSPDFDHWLPESAESFLLPEPTDPKDRGCVKPYAQVHLGVGAASFGNVTVGLYCHWANRPNRGHDWLGLGTTSGDLGLVISEDGISFREPVKGHVYLSVRDSPSTPPEGSNAGYATILCQANGILNVGDETRIYHGRWRNPTATRDYSGEVALATLPRDRWGALGLFPDQKEGSVWSAPVTIPTFGATLHLNADGVKGMRVEIGDEQFGLLDGYSGANAGVPDGDGGLRCRVNWRAGLSRLAGRTVRLRINVKRGRHPEPRLYAVYIGGGGPASPMDRGR